MTVLRTGHTRDLLIGSATQTTDTANIATSRLGPFAIPVPPLAEQHRIVAKFDKLMALCDPLKTRLEWASLVSVNAVLLVDQAGVSAVGFGSPVDAEVAEATVETDVRLVRGLVVAVARLSRLCWGSR